MSAHSITVACVFVNYSVTVIPVESRGQQNFPHLLLSATNTACLVSFRQALVVVDQQHLGGATEHMTKGQIDFVNLQSKQSNTFKMHHFMFGLLGAIQQKPQICFGKFWHFHVNWRTKWFFIGRGKWSFFFGQWNCLKLLNWHFSYKLFCLSFWLTGRSLWINVSVEWRNVHVNIKNDHSSVINFFTILKWPL